eukprot:GHUV01048796.1.p1 GENE.GHUV01048796.1~~GHUV01048796.1.p1  ORF type:complete len:101 (-),score=20.56 GHUV01048796.1:92-394(-)
MAGGSSGRGSGNSRAVGCWQQVVVTSLNLIHCPTMYEAVQSDKPTQHTQSTLPCVDADPANTQANCQHNQALEHNIVLSNKLSRSTMISLSPETCSRCYN